MKKVDSFTLTDTFSSDEDRIKEWALDSARSRADMLQEYVVEDVKVEFKREEVRKVYEVSVLGHVPEVPLIAEYWVQVNPKTKNPTGNICWAFYPDDRPTVGHWIKVTENKDKES